MLFKFVLAALAAVVVLLSGCASIQIPPDSRAIQPVSCFYVSSTRSGVLDLVSKKKFVARVGPELATKVATYEASFDASIRALSADGLQVLSRLPRPEEECNVAFVDATGVITLGTRFVNVEGHPLDVSGGVKQAGLPRASTVFLNLDLASSDAGEVGRSTAEKTVEAIRAARNQ